MPTLKEAFNNANPNTLPTLLSRAKLGNLLRTFNVQLVKAVPAAAPLSLAQPQLATLHKVILPDDAHASSIRQAWSRAGTVTGRLVPQAPDATPTTGQIGVAPNGDITVLAADAITSLDVEYEPLKYDMFLYEGPVVAHDLALPAAHVARGVLMLIAADGTLGAQTGRKIVVAAGARTTTDTHVNMDVTKTLVQFDATDAITYAKVIYAVAPEYNLHVALSAETDIIG